MLNVVSIGVLGAAALIALRGLRYPSYAAVLFLAMFSLEQVVFAVVRGGIPSWVVNVAVGGTCLLLVARGLIRRGPIVDWSVALSVAALVAFTILSTLWTRAPNAASQALLTFVPGVILAFLIGTTVLRDPDDVKRIVVPLVLLSSMIAFVVLVARVPGIAGRVLIVEQGSVLAPSKFMGFGVIALLSATRAVLPWPTVIRLSVAAFLLLVIFVMGARAQFVLALLVGAAGGYISGAMDKRAVGAAAVLVLMALVTPLIEIIVGGEQVIAASGRYSLDSVGEGWRARYDMITSALTLGAPIFGRGVMDWAYHVTQRDQYLYPHNSFAQLFFELGLLGLALFTLVLVRAGKEGLACLRGAQQGSVLHGVSVLLLAFLAYELLISQKQETFMACLGLYMAAFSLTSMRKGLRLKARTDARVRRATSVSA